MKNIIEKAKELKICREWAEKMEKKPTIERFCELYFKGDDWAMENDFPTLPLLREYKEEAKEFGLWVDEKGQIADGGQPSAKYGERLALFGNSEVELEYRGFAVAKLNIRHDSKAKIIVKDYAILNINILDNAEVEIYAKDNARVCIYDYGKNTKIMRSGNVKIELREL